MQQITIDLVCVVVGIPWGKPGCVLNVPCFRSFTNFAPLRSKGSFLIVQAMHHEYRDVDALEIFEKIGWMNENCRDHPDRVNRYSLFNFMVFCPAP
jgi:hypothetical protein